MGALGDSFSDRVRGALQSGDADAFGALLDDDVRWGQPGFPRSCTNRDEVLATLRRGQALGGTAEIGECRSGRNGVLCELLVRWPAPGADVPDATPRLLYHVYLVRDERIVEILPFDERADALAAAGLEG